MHYSGGYELARVITHTQLLNTLNILNKFYIEEQASSWDKSEEWWLIRKGRVKNGIIGKMTSESSLECQEGLVQKTGGRECQTDKN